MQTFFLAQAVVEHSLLSSMTALIGDATYQLQAFIAEMNTTHIVIGLAIVGALMFFWRR